jgi:hypothetical protein
MNKPGEMKSVKPDLSRFTNPVSSTEGLAATDNFIKNNSEAALESTPSAEIKKQTSATDADTSTTIVVKNLVKINVEVPEELRTKLKMLSVTSRTTLNQLILNALVKEYDTPKVKGT